MKRIIIEIGKEEVSIEEKGNLAQIDRLTGLAVLAQSVRKYSTVSDKTTDKQINRTVSRPFAADYVKEADHGETQ